MNERKRVIFTSPEGFTYGAPAMPQAAVEEGTGALEFYFSPTGIFFVEVITLEHRPVALTITGGRPGSERERGQIEDYVLNRSAVLAREQRVHQLVEALINKQEAAEYLVLLRQDVGQRLDAIYGDWCMTGIGQPGSGATLRARMHDRGFWDPLEEDLNLVRATAITSVRTAASDSEPAIGNVLSRLDVTPAELRRRLRSVERDTGLRLLDPLTDRIAV